jgi:hypothetical protein
MENSAILRYKTYISRRQSRTGVLEEYKLMRSESAMKRHLFGHISLLFIREKSA